MSRLGAGGLDSRPQWLGRPERGTAAAIRALTWITVVLGRRIGRIFLYPICLYFLLFSKRSRAASQNYLGRVLGRRVWLIDSFRHYHAFASTVHDRVHLVAGGHEAFDVTVRSDRQVENWLQRERGCILLGAHFGSFEILRAYGNAKHQRPVNVVMHLENAAKTNRVLESIAPHLRSRVIPLGTPESVLQMQECISRGEVVGILGDRVWKDDRAISCEFLGGVARFPVGPLLLAGLLNAPVILFFGVYRGGRRYEILFEPFAECIVLPRSSREATLRSWIERYARRLEHHCRRAPYNWFNFYDYWQ